MSDARTYQVEKVDILVDGKKVGHITNLEYRVKEGSQGSVPKSIARKRGFAAMDPKLVSAIAAKGGKAAHAVGTAHEFSSDEARAAGRKGGFAVAAARRAAREAERAAATATPSAEGAKDGGAP